MGWWWSKHETGDPYARADALYDDSIRLCHVPGGAPVADRAAQEAATEYRALIATTRGIEARRRLAKALWRRSLIVGTLLKSADEALILGKEGVEIGTELLANMSPNRPVFHALVLEVAVAMSDLAQVAWLARRPELREQLLQRAIETARRSDSPAGREALGTATHNLAQHRWEVWSSRGLQPSAADTELQQIRKLASQAVEIREQLCRDPRVAVHTHWELASSMSQLGQLVCSIGEVAAGVALLGRAYSVLAKLSGIATDELRIRVWRQLRASSPSGARADSHAVRGQVEEIEQLVRAGELAAADALSEYHAGLHIDSRRSDEALTLIEIALGICSLGTELTARKALWRERQLRLLQSMGKSAQVLELLPLALEAADDAFRVPYVAPSPKIREQILYHAVGAAKALGQWSRAHQLARLIAYSLEDRDAHNSERLVYRLSTYAALFELGRVAEAETVLCECQADAEALGDKHLLGLALGARGLIASRRGDRLNALLLKRSALRALYESDGHECDKAHTHENYANELWKDPSTVRDAGAHWLAALLLGRTSGYEAASTTLLEKLSMLEGAHENSVPRTLPQLVAAVERTLDVPFGELLALESRTQSEFDAIQIELRHRS
jgi:hypothetical protein